MTILKKADITNKLFATCLKIEGMSYKEVLKRFNLTPFRYANAIFNEIDLLIHEAKYEIGMPEKYIKTLKNRDYNLLFSMEEETLEEQYNSILIGKKNRFYPGTNRSNLNNEYLAYYALSKYNPSIKDLNKNNIINFFSEINSKENLFKRLKLTPLMLKYSEIDNRTRIGYSLKRVIEHFDNYYQKKTNNQSLLDIINL